MFPKEVQARFDLARSYLAQEQPRRSLRELLTIKDQVADSGEFHFLMGMTYNELDSLSKALKHFQKTVTINPDDARAWNNMGQTWYQLGEFNRAEKAFHQALSIQTYLTPEYPAYNLAKIFIEKNDPALAIDCAQRAIGYNKRFIPAYTLLTSLLLQENQVEEAIVWIHRGIKANPNNLDLIFLLAENQLRLGQTSNAIANFKHIISRQPDSEIAQMAKDYVDILSP